MGYPLPAEPEASRMDHMISIRRAGAADIPHIAGWLVELPLMQRYGLTRSTAAKQLQQAIDNKNLVLTADAGIPASPCGLAWIMQNGAFGRSAYLRLLGVSVHYEGRGLGSALLQTAEHLTQADGRDLFLLVSDFNTGARRFYERHGYEQIGAIPDYVIPGITELLYWKHLTINP
jgi:ribosomal protein S18 acetylase RimI-like enzyme